MWSLGRTFFFYKLFWNWIGVMRFVSYKVCFDEGFVIWHFLYYCFCTNCVVMITEYWSLYHFHHQWNDVQNTMLDVKCITEWWRRRFSIKKIHCRLVLFNKRNAPQARLITRNALQANFFSRILKGSLSYWNRMYILFFTNHISESSSWIHQNVYLVPKTNRLPAN